MMFYEGWILTVGVGLVILALFRIFAWRQARKSITLRVMICAVLSCCLAPSFAIFGGGIVIWPASLMLAWALADKQDNGLILLALASLCITFFLMLGLWSRVLRKPIEGRDER